MKALLVLALGILLASTALAQSTQKKNEMFLSVGDAGLIFAIEDMAVTIGSLGVVTEPPRDSRRLHFLRGWGHGTSKQVLARGTGSGGSDGLGA